MEEDTGVKAPVTRLRRRLSVEQSEESKSPAMNTPTKRRGRKKPELELIDENTPENPKPQRTRKTTVKDAIESVEEKPATPARRSTRIKSNTSIASETTVAINSPRAKRATRRTSQIGSDNEAPPTPIRTTRRTRKDSTSSLEKVEVAPLSKPPIQITEVIVEEPETNSRKSTNSEIEDKTSLSPNSFRRSPRLVNKQNQSVNKTEDITDQFNSNQETLIEEKNEIPEENSTPSESLDTKEIKQDISKDRLSISSSNLIKDLDTKGNIKKNKINLNKSTPVVVLHNVEKTKRNRTKSWTAVKESNESNFFSDNENMKKKIKGKLKSTSTLNVSESQDEQNKSLNRNKSKNSNEINNSIVKDANRSVNTKEIETVEDIQNQSRNKQLKIDDNTSLLYKNPTGDIKTVVVIEDSDSNSGKANVQDINDSEDQCVPVIEHAEQNTQEVNQFSVTHDHSIRLNKSKNRTITNNSCEPMDVDETIPDSMVIADTETKANDKSRKSFPDEMETNLSNNDKGNKSQNSENKSVLISTHLKNTSDGKSPKPSNKLLSKSAFDLDVTQEETNNKNISLNYLTSTPLQHKSIQKLAMQVNTSIIASNNDSAHVIENMDINSEKATDADPLNKNDLSNKENKNIINTEYEEKMDISINKETSKNLSSIKQNKLNLSKNKKVENDEPDEETPIKISKNIKSKGSKQKKITSISSNDSISGESDNESRESNMLDDEAEDAGDDYESGDSQNESERQYAEENEIIEKGETLTSENEDLSNDSDYEKDSFIVSSDEEDNELLEGTEDDLSMSDNELKMTAKSKKKYDERKLKEQKRASREMYESRHKIINKTKKKSQQLSSSEELSEAEVESEKPKKNNRMRLDSSNDSEDGNESVSQKKTPVLSESICEEAASEREITIAEESLKENDPLSQIKEEPKTPLKNANETIAFIDSEDTNNDKNESTKTQTELQDPLEAMDDDDDSLCSENQEIMQNYDSILNDLNKSNKIKTKTCDISLNIDKKLKKKDKNSFVDELNLTQVKTNKKLIKKKVSEKETGREEDNSKNDHDSSDSIDIHLLFSEDSNDSESKKKKMADNEDKSTPIKKSESKSIIVEEDINDRSGNISLKQSAKKNKKRKSQLEKVTTDTEDDNNVVFFIDTEGTHNDTLNKSHNKNLKDNKDSTIQNVVSDISDSDEISTQEEPAEFNESPQKENRDSTLNKSIKKSVPTTPGNTKKTTPKKLEQHASDSSDSDAPMEISFKKDKQESTIQEIIEVSQDKNESQLNKSLNKSLVKTPVSEKKKRINTQYTEEKNNESLNRSITKTPKGGKKSLSQDAEAIDHSNENTFIEKSFNKSLAKTPISEKKSQNTLKNNVEDEENVESATKILNTSVGAKKNKKSISELQENISVHEEQDIQYVNLSLIKTPGSSKKTFAAITKSPKLTDNDSQSGTLFNRSITKTPGSERKKNKSVPEELESDNMLQKSMTKTPGSERKKNKSISGDTSEVALTVSTIKTPGSQKKNVSDSKENPDIESKKRKRKLSLTPQVEEFLVTVEDVQAPVLNESLVRNKKKKRKISQQETNEVTIQANKIERQEGETSDNLVKVDVPKKQKSKKRKEREEDDEGNNITKISKQNSFEKAPVSRLPTSVLEQLDDKPQPKVIQPKPKKLKVISTTEFIVEETKKRKAKPSNYLEESVYLDDDDTDECKKKKSKGKIMKPKVLPFVPTASISNQGYTTTFKVNIIPKETKFVAQSSTVDNFKNDYLYNKKIKRQGTYELYKRNRNLKLSKF